MAEPARGVTATANSLTFTKSAWLELATAGNGQSMAA
jgi:hypothetical protein